RDLHSFPTRRSSDLYDITTWSLPLSMGVEVVESDGPFTTVDSRQPARFVPVPAVDWPGGAVDNGVGGYLISHRADTAVTAVNRLIFQGKRVYWLKKPLEAVAGSAPGDIWIPPGEITAEALGKLSREARVAIQPLAAPPAGPAFKVKPVRVG